MQAATQRIEIPSGDFTFETLKDLLLQLTDVVNNHTDTNNRLISTFNEEFKLRPTYNELSQQFIALPLQTPDVTKLYIDSDVLQKVSDELTMKVEMVMQMAEKQFKEFHMNLEKTHDRLLDTRNVFNINIRNNQQLCKKSLVRVETNAKRSFRRWKLQKLLNCWKDFRLESLRKKKVMKRTTSRWLDHLQQNRFHRWRARTVYARLQDTQEVANQVNGKIAYLTPIIHQHSQNLTALSQSKADKSELEILKELITREELRIVFNEIRDIVTFQGNQMLQKITEESEYFSNLCTKIQEELNGKANLQDYLQTKKLSANNYNEITDLSQNLNTLKTRVQEIDMTMQVENLTSRLTQLEQTHEQIENQVISIIEEQNYEKQYGEIVGTRPMCLACGPKSVNYRYPSTSGIMGLDQRLYKADPATNNPVNPRRPRYRAQDPDYVPPRSAGAFTGKVRPRAKTHTRMINSLNHTVVVEDRSLLKLSESLMIKQKI